MVITRTRSRWLLGASFLALGAFAAGPAFADDETGDTSISVRAALDAADCTATPPTVSVLGLTIDVSQATFGGDGGGEDSATQSGGSSGSCDSLVVGSLVDVKLASDAVPLVATQVDQQGNDEGDEPGVEGPLQAVDATNQTVTILGLTIDASGAGLDGADDDSQDGSSQPIDFTQLMVGQFVAVKLDPAQLPALVASDLEVKNFANEVDVEVDDSSGNPVDDSGSDITASVKDVMMLPSATQPGTSVKKVVKLSSSGHGSIRLTGLPTGKAKISLTRTHAGVATSAKIKLQVQPNSAQLVHVGL